MTEHIEFKDDDPTQFFRDYGENAEGMADVARQRAANMKEWREQLGGAEIAPDLRKIRRRLCERSLRVEQAWQAVARCESAMAALMSEIADRESAASDTSFE